MARYFPRGAPPPRGSIEYVAVPDLWEPAPASQSGFRLYEVSYTDLDAANRWVDMVDRSVRYARRQHGDRVLSKADETSWNDFMARWRPLSGDLGLPGHFNAMLASNKKLFDEALSDAFKLRRSFAAKGMATVPVPYASELLELVRSSPKKMTAAEMSAKLQAVAKCGRRLLDEDATWWRWVQKDKSAGGLRDAASAAEKAATIYDRSRESGRTYSPGSPVYDEYLRRASRVWIEAAGLYGVRQVEDEARANFKDDLGPDNVSRSGLWLLGLAGAAYLGVAWLFRPRTSAPDVQVAVPDLGVDLDHHDEEGTP